MSPRPRRVTTRVPGGQVEGGPIAGLAAAAREATKRDRRGRSRDPDAHAVAQEVYETCVVIGNTPGDELPLALRGPATMIAFRAAPGIVTAAGLPKDEETLQDVAAYLVGGIVSMIATFNPEHFRQWCLEADRAERGESNGSSEVEHT